MGIFSMDTGLMDHGPKARPAGISGRACMWSVGSGAYFAASSVCSHQVGPPAVPGLSTRAVIDFIM